MHQKENAIDNERLLPPREVQRILGISRSTLLRWERKGLLTPQYTLTGRRRYPLKEVLALVE